MIFNIDVLMRVYASKRYFLLQVGIIPFCEKESSKTLTKVSSLECNLFDTIVTAKGLCYTFNSKTMSEIFRKSNTIQSWNSVFNLKKKSQIVNPKGYGPFNGLQFATNAFMPSSGETSIILKLECFILKNTVL